MDRTIFVYVDLQGVPCLVGRLWTRFRKNRESASFEYDKAWLSHPDHFALEPALQLGPGPFHTRADQPLFGAIGDSAPDRWGRILMRRAERRRGEHEKTTPRALREIDFLLRVNDEARLGALRFAEQEGGPFLAVNPSAPIPPLVELPRLLAATDHVLSDSESDEELRLLLAPGSSLGGARPKASVRDADGRLMIAKFPSHQDEFSTVQWEALALTLAAKAGLSVPSWRLETAAGRPVLLLQRFDRDRVGRHPFLSALSMLGAKDHERRSYLELVDVLRRHGASPRADMQELWRRVVFSILISNTDDHLRNHGFLYTGPAGWRLAPAYDLNPVPADIKPRILSTAIDLEDNTASLKLAMDVAHYFELEPKAAREGAAQIGKVIARWRETASGLGIAETEMERMASAFDHEDLKLALA